MTVISRLLVKLLNLHITSLAVTKVTECRVTFCSTFAFPGLRAVGEPSDFDTAGI